MQISLVRFGRQWSQPTPARDSASARSRRRATRSSGSRSSCSPSRATSRRRSPRSPTPPRSAPRTIFAYFPSKEDILFCDSAEIQERLAHALRERPDGATALDALREFIFGSLAPDSTKALRKCIVASDETLQRSERARFAPLEQLMAEAIAEDLNAGPDDIRPQIVAAAIFAAFNTLSDRDPGIPPQPFSRRTRYGSNRRRHKLPARRPRSAQTRLGTSTVRLPGRSGCIQMRSTSASGTTLAATPIAPQLISSMSEGSSAT